MKNFDLSRSPKTERIARLVEDLYAKMPEIESARAVLYTESFRQTENQPMVLRKAKAFAHVLDQIPIIIRPNELIVGSSTLAPRGCQTFPEFSFEWLEQEFDTVANREADPFFIAEETKKQLHEADKYWKGRTTSDLALSYMSPEAIRAQNHNIFTVGNYFYNGVGHFTVQYWKVLELGIEGIMREVKAELDTVKPSDADYGTKSRMLESCLIACAGIIRYANRYAALAKELAAKETNKTRKEELLRIAENCTQVPEKPARNFYEACQSFWFVQQLIQMESSGHSISPGRFDQYMYPYYRADLEAGVINHDDAQELLDCIWVKLNDLNKCRDAESAKGFAGYSLFQNLIVGGQDEQGRDATNDLSFMCIDASMHVFLPMPSLSIRVWNQSPQELLLRAAELTRTGIGLPAYYNDEVIIPSLMSRGIPLEEARNYSIIGCVEPQVMGKTLGWHDAAFFNMVRPMELVFTGGVDMGEQIGPKTKPVEEMQSFEEFFDAYQEQMNYFIGLLVNADNAVDLAHRERAPLAFISTLMDDCIKRGKTPEQGGAIYNFTGPQGFGVANIADSLYTVKKLVFEDHRCTLAELKQALRYNFGKEINPFIVAQIAGDVTNSFLAQHVTPEPELVAKTTQQVIASVSEQDRKRMEEIYEMILDLPKFGNDIPEVDEIGREAAYCYTRPLLQYRNPRGGIFQAGLYPVSANVPLGFTSGASPDGRLARQPVADGVSPSQGRDVNGPTAAANSVAMLDHGIASNGTLYNQKFHPTALAGQEGLIKFIDLIRTFFDRKGMHMQFNVVSRETLLDAQQHPENYKGLIVRVAGYSALFTGLSKSLQDDIISRTEQGL
ncbi:glycyl radical protein [Agathobacter ruminis]|uniref:Formate C-acetyltransferase/glycerol dehydratase family glycyl radical enzyme n=1 Tax=Agathobacter ruminis TaxID=1712665 RepID=A0A2G3E6D0_9FIRM|nr:glycyl radical protein [Agathobacter ruminis]MDC7301696.1 glycyl radical protein [Agathobacter ruminis]PHU38826.1 formate C-acetyltransferase/glycerol dehydratase family glycyl radical enzyme [Agathobacter ruminis]